MSQVEQYFFMASAALGPRGEFATGGGSDGGGTSIPISMGSALMWVCGVPMGELLFSCTRLSVATG